MFKSEKYFDINNCVCGLVSMSSDFSGALEEWMMMILVVLRYVQLPYFAYVITLILWDYNGVYTILKMYYLSLVVMIIS